MKYLNPETPTEALLLKNNNPDYYFLAGGTLLNSLHFSNKTINGLISLEKLGLNEIRKDHIGSMTTLEDIRINSLLPGAIKESAAHVVNRNIRNIATIGGNIAANKSSSDMIPVLIALKTQIDYLTEAGQKTAPLSSWIKNPEGLILGLKFPAPDRQIYQKRFSRTKNDVPILKIAIGANYKDSIFEETIITAGCLDGIVIELTETAAFLNGKTPDEINMEYLHKIAQDEINPKDDIRSSAQYRRHLVNIVLSDFINNNKNGN